MTSAMVTGSPLNLIFFPWHSIEQSALASLDRLLFSSHLARSKYNIPRSKIEGLSNLSEMTKSRTEFQFCHRTNKPP